MENALKQKETLISIKEHDSNPMKISKEPYNPIKGKVIIITDGRCGSSCLAFLDEATNIPNIILVGKTTHANSIYTAYRKETLSSEFAILGFPMMSTINRKRLSNQPYVPTYIFPDDINYTGKLKKWIIQLHRLDKI